MTISDERLRELGNIFGDMYGNDNEEATVCRELLALRAQVRDYASALNGAREVNALLRDENADLMRGQAGGIAINEGGGTTECPICGSSVPHRHGEREAAMLRKLTSYELASESWDACRQENEDLRAQVRRYEEALEEIGADVRDYEGAGAYREMKKIALLALAQFPDPPTRCNACDPLNPGDVGEPHTCTPDAGRAESKTEDKTTCVRCCGTGAQRMGRGHPLENCSACGGSGTSPREGAPDETYPGWLPKCDVCGEDFDPVFGACRNANHQQKPPPAEPDEAERVAREWYIEHVREDDVCLNGPSLAALLRTQRAAAREAGRREEREATLHEVQRRALESAAHLAQSEVDYNRTVHAAQSLAYRNIEEWLAARRPGAVKGKP